MPKASMNKRVLGDDKGEVEMKPNFMRFGEEWSLRGITFPCTLSTFSRVEDQKRKQKES